MIQFSMHEESPNIVQLQVHLPNQQLITWNEDNAPDIQAIIEEQGNKDTILTAYFKTSVKYPEAKELLYQDFPSKFVWKAKERKWQPRQQHFAICCMYYAHPSSREHFYLHTAVKGATLFENLRCVGGGDPLPTFHQACLARGLLEDDGNVYKKLLIWQVVTSSETYLSPFMIALLPILWHYG